MKPILCECGSIIRQDGKRDHLKTKNYPTFTFDTWLRLASYVILLEIMFEKHVSKLFDDSRATALVLRLFTKKLSIEISIRAKRAA